MKNSILFLLLIAGTLSPQFAQNKIDLLLQEIEINNPILASLRKNAEAEIIMNKTGIYLENPEVEFNYLLGNPGSLGNRKDIRITQTFDFPIAYKYKFQNSALRNNQVKLEFDKQKKNIFLQARKLCIELIFRNAMHEEYKRRLLDAQHLSDAYNEKFKRGACSLPDLNKAMLNLYNLKVETELNSLEKNATEQEIAQLNGGKYFPIADTSLEVTSLIHDFDTWFSSMEANNPSLNWLQEEIKISKNQEKLNMFLSFPRIQGGYMSEEIPGENFQGITMGFSIPLMQHKNQVKYARLKTEALESMASSERTQYYYRLHILYQKAKKLEDMRKEYRNQLSAYIHPDLLEKAVDLGEISLIQYFNELSNYYESIDRLLLLEKNRNLALAELLEGL